MRGLRIVFFLSIFIVYGFCVSAKSGGQQADVVVFDTTQRTSELYAPCIALAESAGFKTSYFPVDSVIDEPNLMGALSHHKGIIFVFGPEFLQGMQQQSSLVGKVLTFMDQFCRMPGKLVGLVLPPLLGLAHAQSKNQLLLVKALAPIFNRLGCAVPLVSGEQQFVSSREASEYDFFEEVNRFLSNPLEKRALSYHTTLRPPAVDAKDLVRLDREPNPDLLVLPSLNVAQYSLAVQGLMPFGLCWFNRAVGNVIWVTSLSLFSFGIKENFHLVPTDEKIKQELLKGMHQMFWELHEALIPQSDLRKPRTRFTKKLPKSLRSLASLKKKSSSRATKTAWMEINLFQQKNYDLALSSDFIAKDQKVHSEKKQLLVDYILKSGLDTLWISFAPNMFYSPIAREHQKEKTFLDSISQFTTMLQDSSREQGVEIPKILVGFEVTNNIYEPNLPKNCAVDLYGSSYEDLPAPLDKNFWDNEVKKPLETFVQRWKDPAISHGVPLSGVVLDLEMYCRKKSGLFLSTMGFEAATFQPFAQQNGLLTKSVQGDEITRLLMQERMGKKYFDYLEAQADQLGNDLKNFFSTQIPDCLIACYAPSLLVEWFYKGLWKGLSSEKNRLHLYTFNTEFRRYQPWLKKQGIHADHSSVLLLSKIQNKKDFNWVDTTLKNHDGVWLNRFSRLVEDYDASSWIHVEQTPISADQKDHFMQHMSLLP